MLVNPLNRYKCAVIPVIFILASDISMMKVLLLIFGVLIQLVHGQKRYAHVASTTYFGEEAPPTHVGACNGCPINVVTRTEHWAAVATPQSMQSSYENPYSKADNCCLCGTGRKAHAMGKVAAGCGMCFEARSTGRTFGNLFQRPQPQTEFNMVVVDSCKHSKDPKVPNHCPEQPGDKNENGFLYHFDIYIQDRNKLGLGENPIVLFNPIKCPAFIEEIMELQCCKTGAVCPRQTTPEGLTYGTCSNPFQTVTKLTRAQRQYLGLPV